MRYILICCALTLLNGCSIWDRYTGKTQAESLSGYTYIPLDPSSVLTIGGRFCKIGEVNYLSFAKSLPDNTMRMSVEQFHESGAVTYGPASSIHKGDIFRVTVDYTNADTTKMELWISKKMKSYKNGKMETVGLLEKNDGEYIYNSELYDVKTSDPQAAEGQYIKFNLPVYVGIGLRVTAEINVLSAKANISGIGGIGAEVEASYIKGSMIIQTLGINGQKIAAALPIQSELNQTTAQNAIVAISQIKSLIYDDNTVKSARVLGLYLPFPGGKPLVNSIISAISGKGITWKRPCKSAAEIAADRAAASAGKG